MHPLKVLLWFKFYFSHFLQTQPSPTIPTCDVSVALKGRHGGPGVTLQTAVWSTLIFTLADTKAKLWVCLCVCCQWNAAYINSLNLTCPTLRTALKHQRTPMAARERERERENADRKPSSPETACVRLLVLSFHFFFWLPVTFVSFLTLGNHTHTHTHSLKGTTALWLMFILWFTCTIHFQNPSQMFACKMCFFLKQCFCQFEWS